jgi:hypothetical protein
MIYILIVLETDPLQSGSPFSKKIGARGWLAGVDAAPEPCEKFHSVKDTRPLISYTVVNV